MQKDFPGQNPTKNPIRSLFANISLAVVLNLLIKSAWILLNNVVQDRIGHDRFGIYMALYSLGFLFIALADMGINQYATKTLAGKPEDLRKLFPNLFGIKILLSLVYPVFMLGVGYLLGYNFEELKYLFLLCLTHGVVQIIFFFRANFQAFQKFKLDAFASVLDRAILLAIIAGLLLTEISLDSYIFALFISVGVALIVLYFAMIRLFGRIAPKFNRSQALSLLKQSFPFAVITVLYSINDKVDQVMLERLYINGDTETGLYAGAYRWVDAFMMYLWTVLPIFFAKFAANLSNARAQTRLLNFGQGIAALPMIFASIFVFFYGEKLLWLFKDSSTAELLVMETCMKILFIAVLINGFFAIYSTLLTSTGHERFVSWMIGISIAMNISLNFIFIPEYGAIASAWTTLVSFGFLSLTYIWYITFRLPVKLPFLTLGKLFLLAAACTGSFLALDQAALPWWIVSGISGLVLLILTYFAGIIKLKQDID